VALVFFMRTVNYIINDKRARITIAVLVYLIIFSLTAYDDKFDEELGFLGLTIGIIFFALFTIPFVLGKTMHLTVILHNTPVDFVLRISMLILSAYVFSVTIVNF